MNPLIKQKIYIDKYVLEYSSFVNYHLVLLKLYDNCIDTKYMKKWIYKIMYYIMCKNKKYRFLSEKFMEVTQKTKSYYDELHQLESNNCMDYDKCSETMGNILYEIINFHLLRYPIEDKQSVLSFSKHLGMWIYLIDAYDDYEMDLKKKNFNPLNSFSANEKFENKGIDCLRIGEVMLGMMRSNLVTLLNESEIGKNQEIIENIICFGMQHAVRKIHKRRYKNECNND